MTFRCLYIGKYVKGIFMSMITTAVQCDNAASLHWDAHLKNYNVVQNNFIFYHSLKELATVVVIADCSCIIILPSLSSVCEQCHQQTHQDSPSESCQSTEKTVLILLKTPTTIRGVIGL